MSKQISIATCLKKPRLEEEEVKVASREANVKVAAEGSASNTTITTATSFTVSISAETQSKVGKCHQ